MSSLFEKWLTPQGSAVRRSELTCPAHSSKMMAKAAASPADEVIFDLEDACAVSQKVAARATLVEALKTFSFGAKVRAFRPNGVRTPYFYRDVIDVVENAGSEVDALILPKVNTADEVQFADRLLTQIEQNKGLAVGRIQIEVLIETAKALLHAEAIASASPRVASLIFGVADYAGDIGARHFTSDADRIFYFPRCQIIAAARATGVAAIDAVTVQFKDLDQVRKDAQAGAQLGFDGKWAIHPSHIDILHEAYTPSRPELERALVIVQAYEAANQRGEGAIVLDDEMIDAASLGVEFRKLAVARRAGLLTPEGKLI